MPRLALSNFAKSARLVVFPANQVLFWLTKRFCNWNLNAVLDTVAKIEMRELRVESNVEWPWRQRLSLVVP